MVSNKHYLKGIIPEYYNVQDEYYDDFSDEDADSSDEPKTRRRTSHRSDRTSHRSDRTVYGRHHHRRVPKAHGQFSRRTTHRISSSSSSNSGSGSGSSRSSSESNSDGIEEIVIKRRKPKPHPDRPPPHSVPPPFSYDQGPPPPPSRYPPPPSHYPPPPGHYPPPPSFYPRTHPAYYPPQNHLQSSPHPYQNPVVNNYKDRDTENVDSYGRPIRPGALAGTDFRSILPDHPFGVGIGDCPPIDESRPMRVLQFWTWLTELKVIVRLDQRIAQDGREREVPEERISTDFRQSRSAEPPEQGDASRRESVDEGGIRVNGKAAEEKEKEDEAEVGNSDDNDHDEDGTSSTFSRSSSAHTTGDSSKDGAREAVSRPLRRCDILDDAGDWCGTITLPERWAKARNGVTQIFIAISDAKSLTEEECPVWNYYVPRERSESEWDLYYVMLLERTGDRSMWERRGLGKVFKPAFKDAEWSEIKLG
ncbi:hypothetical protein RB601_007086 [Gaeumannomyces tritici]